MPDNAEVNSGTGIIVACDEVTIGVTAVKVQRIKSLGNSDFTPVNATVNTTAGLIAAAKDTRGRIVLVNNGAVTAYIGKVDVTTSGATKGTPLAPGAMMVAHHTAALYGITATDSAEINGWEEHD